VSSFRRPRSRHRLPPRGSKMGRRISAALVLAICVAVTISIVVQMR
jgi:hypothetical protein